MLLVGALLALVALGAALFLTRPDPARGPGSGGAAGPDAAPPQDSGNGGSPASPGPKGVLLPDGADLAEPMPRSGPLLLPPRRPQRDLDPLAALRPGRFEGRGEIRVRCSTRSGVAFPEHWVLHVGPAAALIGAERAETRTLELDGSARETVVTGLALGGYELRATAPLMNSEAALVLLSLPNHTSLSAELVLDPAGYITGRLVDPEGDPVEGFELSLESRASGELRTALTDVGGGYLFPDVLNGEYRLFVGRPEAPLRDPLELAFQAPTLTLRALEVPALCELEVAVFDGGGLVVADALVQGWCATGGRVDGHTGTFGRYEQRFLPAGDYTLIATHERLGRARGRVRLAPGQRAQVELRFEL